MASHNTLWSCEHQGDSALRFIDAKTIQSVVAMIPHTPMIEAQQLGEWFFLVKKPGLDIAVIGACMRRCMGMNIILLMRHTSIQYGTNVIILVIHEFEDAERHRLVALYMSFHGLIFSHTHFELQVLISTTRYMDTVCITRPA